MSWLSTGETIVWKFLYFTIALPPLRKTAAWPTSRHSFFEFTYSARQYQYC